MGTLLFWAALAIVGFLAGLVSSAAGLASLISYPALLMFGLSPIMANVTNTFGTITSSGSALLASIPEIKHSAKQIIMILPITVIGAVIGSFLLFMIPEAQFKHLVPFFMLFAAVTLLWPRRSKKGQSLGEESHQIKHARVKNILAYVGIWLVSIYQGYFGAGEGVLVLTLFTVINHDQTYATNNAIKNVSITVTNILSVIIYAFETTILWGYVLPMAVGYFCGGLVGPRVVRYVPTRVMQVIVGIGALILALALAIW